LHRGTDEFFVHGNCCCHRVSITQKVLIGKSVTSAPVPVASASTPAPGASHQRPGASHRSFVNFFVKVSKAYPFFA
jgi:hypothetical protein